MSQFESDKHKYCTRKSIVITAKHTLKNTEKCPTIQLQKMCEKISSVIMNHNNNNNNI